MTLNVVLTIEDSTPPELTNCSVTSQTLECDGENNETIANNWNLANIAALEACVGDSCDPDFSGQVASDYSYQNLNSTCGQGGTIPVEYTITDDCGNSVTLNVVLTIEDSTPPELTNCSVTNENLECSDDNEAAADAWNAANIAALETCVSDSCDPDFSGQVSSDYDFDNLSTTCGPCGNISVTYTITDDCGNSTTLVAILSFDDNTVPDLSECNVINTTLECDGENNEAMANQWDIDNLAALEACAEDLNVTITSNYSYQNIDSTCGQGGTIPVTYTVTDDCNNSVTLNVVLTIEDSTPPELANCSVTSQTLECDGENNEVMANNWNSANIAALEACIGDSCDPDFSGQVASNYSYQNLSSTCGQGGTIPVEYTITDDCGNSITLNVVLTIEDSTPPELSEGNDGSAECTGTNPALNQEYIDWINDFAGIQVIEDCSTATLTVVESEWISDGCSYTKTISVIATDECGFVSDSQERTFVISDTTPPEVISSLEEVVFYCNEVPPVPELDIEENCSDNATVVFTEITEGAQGLDNYQIIRTWVITDDCGNETIKEQILLVAPECDCLDDKFISKAITPNGDIYNDYFKVEGIDDCGTPSLKIFNRWGALVYQSDLYDSKKGRWRGTSQGGMTIGTNNELPTGTYYYIIEIRNRDIKPITGHVYLSTK